MTQQISVIIPIYNVEPYLRRCIDSILAQTYFNLEIILIDDGSPDNCPAICDEYAKNDTRIKVIHKKNGGLSDARNIGLEIANGEYFTFIDSDDWIETNYIETLLEIAHFHNSEIVISSSRKQPSNMHCSSEPIIIKHLSQTECLHELFSRKKIEFITSWGKLYKKELFNNIHFPVGKFHEDEFTSYKLYAKAKKISWTNQILYNYFQRKNSIMSAQHPEDLLEAEEQQFHYILENKLTSIYSTHCDLLCWQILSLLAIETDAHNKKVYLDKFKKYQTYLSIKTPSFLRFFLLKTINLCPSIYLLYKKWSSFHFRVNKCKI